MELSREIRKEIRRYRANKRAIERDDRRHEDAVDWISQLTDRQRLRWIVETFAREDLDRLAVTALEELGSRLRQIVPIGWTWRPSSGPLDVHELGRIQGLIRTGLHAILADPRPVGEIFADVESGWQLPRAKTERIVRSSEPGNRRTSFMLNSVGDEATVLIRGVAELVLQDDGRLRACAYCDTAFVASDDRQTFCQPSCGQRARDRRKTLKRAGKQVTRSPIAQKRRRRG